jgi:hypothetical protein
MEQNTALPKRLRFYRKVLKRKVLQRESQGVAKTTHKTGLQNI